MPGELGTCDSLNCRTGFCTTSTKASGALGCCTAFSTSIAVLSVSNTVCVSATEIMFSINVRESERVKGSKNRLKFFSLKVVCAKNAQILSYINYKSWSLFSESADCCFKVNFLCHSSIPCHILSAVKSYIGFWWPLNDNLFTVN